MPAPSRAFAQSDDLAVKSQRAKEFMAEGKFADAVLLYRELNLAVPNNPGLMLDLGMALQMAGDERKSLPPLETAVKLDPKLAPAWLFLGAAHLQLGQTPAGVEALKTVLSLQPDHRDAREMLASALLSLDRAAEAEEHYRKLADVDPQSSPAWYGLGRSYESLSVRAFNDLQKAAPESAYWLALVAEARLRELQSFISTVALWRRCQRCAVCTHRWRRSIAGPDIQTGRASKRRRSSGFPNPTATRRHWSASFAKGSF